MESAAKCFIAFKGEECYASAKRGPVMEAAGELRDGWGRGTGPARRDWGVAKPDISEVVGLSKAPSSAAGSGKVGEAPKRDPLGTTRDGCVTEWRSRMEKSEEGRNC